MVLLQCSTPTRTDARAQTAQGADTKNRLGPVGYHKLKQMYESGEINSKETRCWAQGMEGWRTLREIPQLKWLTAGDQCFSSRAQDARGHGLAYSGPFGHGNAVSQHAHPHLRRLPIPVCIDMRLVLV